MSCPDRDNCPSLVREGDKHYGVPCFLANKDFPEINGELLPWAVPEKVARRPDRRSRLRFTEFCHVTSISPGETAKIRFFEALRLDGGCLLRIFSEYGVKGPDDLCPRYPRVCLKLLVGDKLRFKVVVAGRRVRYPLEVLVDVEVKDSEDIVHAHVIPN